MDPQSRQEERSIPPPTGYNFFQVAIFSPVLSDFGFAFERALSNHTFYYNYAPGHQYDNLPRNFSVLSPKKLVIRGPAGIIQQVLLGVFSQQGRGSGDNTLGTRLGHMPQFSLH